MRVLVVDPRLLVEGAVVPESRARKLLVLLYYGYVTNFVRLYATGDDRTLRHMDRLATAGGPSYEQLVSLTEERAVTMADMLPPGAPDDLGLAISPPLLEQVDGAAHRVSGLAPTLDPRAVRLRILAASAFLVDPAAERRTFSWDARWGRSSMPVRPPRTHMLDTVAAAGGHLLVTNDGELVPEDGAHAEFQDIEGGHVVRAFRLDRFVEEQAGGTGFDIDAVRPDLLEPVPVLPPLD